MGKTRWRLPIFLFATGFSIFGSACNSHSLRLFQSAPDRTSSPEVQAASIAGPVSSAPQSSADPQLIATSLPASIAGGYSLVAGQAAAYGNLILAMQLDGNLVIYRNQTAVWATSFFPGYAINGFSGPTQGMSCAGCAATFQADGNLVLTKSDGNTYWASSTSPASGATLHLQGAHPYVSIVDQAGTVLWDPIPAGLTLFANQSVTVSGLTLSMQNDGNLVLYRDGASLWATSQMSAQDAPGFSGPTAGLSCSGCFAVFQADGNLVLYNPRFSDNPDHAYWASGSRAAGGLLWLRSSTPYVSITDVSNKIAWSSLQTTPQITAFNHQIDAGDASLDYVLQDVCVDISDHPVKGDPANCVTHRNLRIGEQVPYLSTDMDIANGNARYQANFSIPLPGSDGTLRIMTTKSLTGDLNPDFRFHFDETHVGFDLLDVTGPYFSFIRTSDPECLDQAFSTSSEERRNGWIAFGPGGGGGSLVHDIRHTQLSAAAPAICTTRQGSDAEDVWNPPAPVTFESGKNLQSVVTYHYTNRDLSRKSNALERYFFTREYGFTRWEYWIPLSRCTDPQSAGSPAANGKRALCDPSSTDNPLKGRCNPAVIPATATWGEQSWVRLDCRDTTFTLDLNSPSLPVDARMAREHGWVDVDPLN